MRLLVSVIKSLEDFNKHKKKFISLMIVCVNDDGYDLAHSTQVRLKKFKSKHRCLVSGRIKITFMPNFQETLNEHKLTEFAKIHSVDSLQSFSLFLTKLRYICKHQIHLYTGMRHDEVKLLKYECIIRESMSWGESVFIVGITTKMQKTRKLVKWLTCESVVPAVELAQAITKVVADRLGYEVSSCSLFIPHTILEGRRSVFPKSDDSVVFEQNQCGPKSIIVEQSDIDEIDEILLGVDWGKYPYVKVGLPWPFRCHQYRRSLAIYGSNSGLVELSSLKYQLKHLTDSMTLYYGEGSQRSKNILGECQKDHFIY